MSEIFYKVAKLGEPVKEFFAQNGDSKVKDAIGLSGYATDGYQIRVNNVAATEDTPLRDGAIITLVPKLKAG